MPPNSPYALEICVETPDGISAAAQFADRIELCQGLDVGGLTPDVGLLECAADSGVETHVLIRGRSGNFEMSRDELAVACATRAVFGCRNDAENDPVLGHAAIGIIINWRKFDSRGDADGILSALFGGKLLKLHDREGKFSHYTMDVQESIEFAGYVVGDHCQVGMLDCCLLCHQEHFPLVLALQTVSPIALAHLLAFEYSHFTS